MAARLSLFSLNNHKHHPESYYYKHNNQVVNPAARAMWNPSQEDDDSWEVRAFAQDTGNILGATWPPRSYTCTFCRREFRSAQALGGHMNVHRRDRARLHHHHHYQSTLTQPLPPSPSSSSTSSSSTTLIIPATQEFSTINNGGGFCLLYHHQLPHQPSDIGNNNVNAIFNPTKMNACVDSTSSTLVSISPDHNSSNNARVLACAQSVTAPPLQLQSQQIDSSYRRTVVVGSSSYGGNSDSSNISCKESEREEIDLELRL